MAVNCRLHTTEARKPAAKADRIPLSNASTVRPKSPKVIPPINSGNASMGVYAGGGPGYCLSERAARFLVDEPVTRWAEDWWVGTVMRKHGVPLHLDSRFTNYPNMPRHSNDFITSHIANTPVIYDKAKMYEVRSLSTGFDSTDDVVLSVIKDYNWQQVMPYAVSLSRSGFKGTKLMFVQNIGADARENLTRLGFKLIDFTTSDRERLFWTTRYEPALQYMLMNMDRHRYVIWADVRDLVFQSNPSVWLENNLRPHKLVAASECIHIKDEAINTGWVRQTYGEEGLTWLGEHEVCCGGTIAGNADVVYDFLGTVHDALLSTKVPIIDQSVVNYTLRVSPFKDIARIPRMAEGWAATCSWFLSSEGDFSRFWTDQSPVFDKQTGLVKDPQRGNPFPILHQYDRDWSWKVLIEEKYKEWPAPPSPQHHPQSRPLRKLNRLGR